MKKYLFWFQFIFVFVLNLIEEKELYFDIIIIYIPIIYMYRENQGLKHSIFLDFGSCLVKLRFKEVP